MSCIKDLIGNTPEYKLGVKQLEQWHEQCRCKRLGVKFKPRTIRLRHLRKFANVKMQRFPFAAGAMENPETGKPKRLQTP